MTSDTRFKLAGLAAGMGLLLTAGTALAQDSAPGENIEQAKTRTCVNIRSIRRTDVIDDQTIVFEMMGRKLYKNTLPNRCPRLGFERSFLYQTSITQLCNVDIITVLSNIGGGFFQGPACGLGKFEPIGKDDYAALRQERKDRRKGKTSDDEALDDTAP